MSNVCPLDYRYGREDMKNVFSEDSRIRNEMLVEAALARAHASLGTIPQSAADEITRAATLEVVSVDRIKQIESETRHDLMAMVKAVTEKCEGDAGKYVHLGATSNDIVDTATALQLKELEGTMHRSEDVAAMTEDLVYSIRNMLNALPGRLATDVANTDSPAEAADIIRRETNRMLRELANYHYNPEAYAARVNERRQWEGAADVGD